MLGRPAREQHLITQSVPVLAGTVSIDQAPEATPNRSVLCQYANADFAPVVALIERIEGK